MGMIFAFVLSLSVIFLGGFLIYYEKNWEGIGLILSDLIALSAVFIYGRHTQRKELEKRRASFSE